MDNETDEVPVRQARETFADLIDRALHENRTTTITRRGKAVAVIAPAPKEHE